MFGSSTLRQAHGNLYEKFRIQKTIVGTSEVQIFIRRNSGRFALCYRESLLFTFGVSINFKEILCLATYSLSHFSVPGGIVEFIFRATRTISSVCLILFNVTITRD